MTDIIIYMDKKNRKRRANQEIEISITTVINVVVILFIVGMIAFIKISKSMKIQSIEGHKAAANKAVETVQKALEEREGYDKYAKGWGNFLGTEFCTPPLGLDVDMLTYGSHKDPTAPTSLASYLICSPDRGISPPVILTTGGHSNKIFSTKDGMIYSHMGSAATKWDRAFYVDTNGSRGPTASIVSYRKKRYSLDGGYGETVDFPNLFGKQHEKCAPNDSGNEHPDVICLIIRGGNKIIPGDERTKNILETGKAAAGK